MKKGDYVRRVLSSGKFVGPYMQVMAVKEDEVYCDVLEQDWPNIKYRPSNLQVIPDKTLCIPEETLIALKKGKEYKVKHLECSTWSEACDQQIKIVTFYCMPKRLKYRFLVEDIFRSRSGDIVILISRSI